MVALTAAGFVGGRWIGSLPDRGFDQGAPAVTDQGAVRATEDARRATEAALLIGVRPEDVLFTEDGVLAVDDRGVVVDLVLIRPSPGGPRAIVIGTSVPSGRGATIGSVTCAEHAELAHLSYVWGRFEPIESVAGPGDYKLVDGRQVIELEPGHVQESEVTYLMYAYTPEADANATLEVRRVWNWLDPVEVGPPDEFAERECLEHDYDPDAMNIVPHRIRCAEFASVTVDEQRAVTDALVEDAMLTEIDRVEELSPAFPRDNTIAAAASSLDQWCQEPGNRDALVVGVLKRAYGFE
jgi:hypothetical protein